MLETIKLWAKKWLLTNKCIFDAMKHWKYSYDYNQTFKKESNLSIK